MGGKPKAKKPAPPPTIDNSAAELQAAEEAATEAERKRRGRAGTIATSNQGLTTSANTASTVLLGS